MKEKDNERDLWTLSSSFISPSFFSSIYITSIHFILFNHIWKGEVHATQESIMLLFKDLIQHFKLIHRLHILSLFLILKEKVKKRVSPFSTSLLKQQGERGRLMDSIYSSMLPFPSHKQAFITKSKTSFELCNTFTLFALLASLEGWDE